MLFQESLFPSLLAVLQTFPRAADVVANALRALQMYLSTETFRAFAAAGGIPVTVKFVEGIGQHPYLQHIAACMLGFGDYADVDAMPFTECGGVRAFMAVFPAAPEKVQRSLTEVLTAIVTQEVPSCPFSAPPPHVNTPSKHMQAVAHSRDNACQGTRSQQHSAAGIKPQAASRRPAK